MNRSFSPPLPLVSPSQRPICLYFTCARAQKTLSCRCESFFFSHYTYHSLVILFISTIVYPFPLSTSQQRTYHYLFLYIYSHHVLYSFCKNNIKSNYLYPETITDTNRIPRTAVYIPCDPCIDKGSLCVCMCVLCGVIWFHTAASSIVCILFSLELEHTPFFSLFPPFYGRTSWKLYMRVADSYSSMPTLTCRRILWVIFARSCTLFIPNFLLLHIGGLSTAGK